MTGTQAFFLPVADGQRYCLYHQPKAPLRHLVVYIHPFAEELNKTRRMASLASRALAAAGDAVLQIDLLGCGDSSGDFADAHWNAWLDDLQAGAHWLWQRHGRRAVWWWGTRAGCLLGADAARRLDAPCQLLWWQPSFADGAQQLQQFLRLRLAAGLVAEVGAAPQRTPGAMEALREQLRQGRALDIAGYTLSAHLAAGLQASRLLPPVTAAAGAGAQLVWLEVSSNPAPTLSPLANRTLEQWRAANWRVHGEAVAGPAFWQSSEIEEAPALIEATLAALAERPAP